MNSETWAIPIATFIVMAGGVLFTVLTFKNKANLDYVHAIKGQMDLQSTEILRQSGEILRINTELTECLKRCQDAQKENIRLTSIALEHFIGPSPKS